jgi:hypothetical protein
VALGAAYDVRDAAVVVPTRKLSDVIGLHLRSSGISSLLARTSPRGAVLAFNSCAVPPPVALVRGGTDTDPEIGHNLVP